MKILLLALLIIFTNTTSVSADELALQCESPRMDIFLYKDGKAGVAESFSDGSLRPSEWKVLSFDQRLLKAVFYKTSGS